MYVDSTLAGGLGVWKRSSVILNDAMLGERVLLLLAILSGVDILVCLVAVDRARDGPLTYER